MVANAAMQGTYSNTKTKNEYAASGVGKAPDSAAATAVTLGQKVTINTDGLSVTATTTSGVAEVVYMDGTASGSMCRVRF